MAGNGLRIRRAQGMEGFTANTAEFSIDPANTNPIFFGDPVQLSATGNVEQHDGTALPVLGTFAGWRNGGDVDDELYANQVGQLGGRTIPFAQWWTGAAQPADTIPTAIVNLPPMSMFHIYGDTTVDWSTVGPTSAGTRVIMVANAGDTRTGDSRYAAGAVDPAGPLQIHRLVPMPGNSWANAEPLIEVVVVAQQGTAADVA